MPTMKDIISKDVFDYDAFHKDLKREAKRAGTTFVEICEKDLFRSPTYLTNAFSKKAMQLRVAEELARRYRLSLKDYEIRKPEPKPEPVVLTTQEWPPAEMATPVAISGAETEPWTCFIKIDEEFGTCMMKVMHNGEKVAVGRSFLFGTNDVGIMQSISYAAHMCYKIVQQGSIEKIQDNIPENAADSLGPERLVFKDWVLRYVDVRSEYGRFARYVRDHHEKFPSSGEKQMRYHLDMNKGDAHKPAFSVLFKQYRHWCRSNGEM